MESKPFTASKLNWVGIILVVAGVLSDPQYSSLVSGFVPTEYLPKVMSAVGLLVVVLRTFFTSAGVTVGKIKNQITGILMVAVIPGLIWMPCIALSGCASSRTNPVGCEDSMIYANKAQIDVVASVMVSGARLYAITHPAEYARIHDACVAAAKILSGQQVSLGSITADPYLQIMAPLLGLIPTDKVLGQCDRDYLAAYLLMI